MHANFRHLAGFVLLLCLVFSFGCRPALLQTLLIPLPPNAEPQLGVQRNTKYISSARWEDHLPDVNCLNAMPVREIRVNFHLMNSSDSSQNFSEEKGREYVLSLLHHANMDLDTNVRNWRSPDGTAVLPRRYRYVLWPPVGTVDEGIYYRYDDAHYFYVVSGKNQNNYNRDVIKKYTVGGDSVVNVFVQVHHPDSMKSATYKGQGMAIALGSGIKLSGLYELGEPPQNFRGMFNHEVGHTLGLGHAWVEDGCPDTDPHPNKCYDWQPEGFCSLNATNNMMDYNAYEHALTPCQIGKIQAHLANMNHLNRRLLIPNWCRSREGMDVQVRDSLVWVGARDLEGSLVVESGAFLRIEGRVSLPQYTRIIVKPGGRLEIGSGARLHNACGMDWTGIFSEKIKDKIGVVHIEEGARFENVINRAQ